MNTYVPDTVRDMEGRTTSESNFYLEEFIIFLYPISAGALKLLSSVWILSKTSNINISSTVSAKWNSGLSEEIYIHSS